MLVSEAHVVESPQTANSPGTIVSVSGDGLSVAVGEGLVGLDILQLEGKKPLRAADFIHGFPLKEGDVLE